MWGPTQNLGPKGSAVFMFLDSDKQTAGADTGGGGGTFATPWQIQGGA